MGEWTNEIAKTHADVKISLSDLIGKLANVRGIDIDWEYADIELEDEDVVIRTPIRLDVRTYYDPGCRWKRNGDPGDPPEWDLEERYSEKEINEACEKAIIGATLEIDDGEDWEYEEE